MWLFTDCEVTRKSFHLILTNIVNPMKIAYKTDLIIIIICFNDIAKLFNPI